jgi:hypothetical protein
MDNEVDKAIMDPTDITDNKIIKAILDIKDIALESDTKLIKIQIWLRKT